MAETWPIQWLVHGNGRLRYEQNGLPGALLVWLVFNALQPLHQHGPAVGGSFKVVIDTNLQTQRGCVAGALFLFVRGMGTFCEAVVG